MPVVMCPVKDVGVSVCGVEVPGEPVFSMGPK